MLGDGEGGYTGVGARDGEIRYEEQDAEGSLVGYSDRTLLLTLDDTLVGIDATTGERSWSVDSAGDEYAFTAWGGSPLAVATVVAAGSDAPAVLGIGDATGTESRRSGRHARDASGLFATTPGSHT